MGEYKCQSTPKDKRDPDANSALTGALNLLANLPIYPIEQQLGKSPVFACTIFNQAVRTSELLAILPTHSSDFLRACVTMLGVGSLQPTRFGADIGFDKILEALGACRGAVCLYKSRI